MVLDAQPGPAGISSSLAELEAAGGRLFLTRDDPAADSWELWTSDGTAGGTTLVAPLDDDGFDSPGNLTAFGGNVLFSSHHQSPTRSRAPAASLACRGLNLLPMPPRTLWAGFARGHR